LIAFDGPASGVGLPEARAFLTIGLPMAVQDADGIETGHGASQGKAG
jgi:hypothetical protein